MGISAREFERLKSKVESIKRDVAKAEGALAEQMKILKKDHGCETLEDAKILLDDVEEKAEKANEKYESVLEKFKDKWGDELGM